MAEGALGISTGQGQGEAQIIKPFQSPVTPQQYGAVMAAQKKAEQDKKAKTLANIETLDFKGMPNEAGLFAKAYDEIVKFVAENVDDPYVDIKMKQKMSDLKTRANMSYDRKMAINNIVGDVQKGEGKNIYLGIDPAIQAAVADMPYDTFSNTEAYGKANAERIAKLNSVKTVPIYDIGQASLDLQRGMAAWGQANKDKNGNWKVPENVIDDFVNKELMGHPHAYATFELAMKNDPVGAKKANYKVDQYAFNTLKDSISAEGYTKSRDTYVNVNIGGDKGDSFDKYSVTEQVFKEGFGVGGEQRDVKQLVAMYPTPVVHGTFKVPVGGTVNGEPSDGTVVVQDVKFNVTKQKAVMDEDITYTGSTGAKITVKKGQVINEADIPLATKVLGRQPKYEYKYISEGFTPEGDIVNVDADIIAPASVAALKGATGKGALGTYQEKSNKELQQKGSKTSKPKSSYMLNGKEYSYDRLLKAYGQEGIDKLIKAGKLK